SAWALVLSERGRAEAGVGYGRRRARLMLGQPRRSSGSTPQPARSIHPLAHQQRRIYTAETKAVTESMLHTRLPAVQRNQIQILQRLVYLLEIQGGRQLVSHGRQYRKDAFYTAGRSEQVAGCRLGRGNRHLRQLPAEHSAQTGHLGAITHWRGGRMGVDVLDIR